jgi:2-polyprenyl-3-methyl-5-hydroxy-6-metoxy-1,4-benzoquinol methylase/MoaA/NifB/PqqE/SkfB family radical SAM enzyme
MYLIKRIKYLLSFLLFNLKIKFGAKPLNADVLLTLKCPNMCDHCLYSATPNSSEFLDKKYLKIIINGLKKIGCKNISLIGGEPFLCLNSLILGLKICKMYNCKVSVFTSACWATSFKKSVSILRKLKKIGLNSLIISTDEFHQKNVPLKNVEQCLKACQTLQIPTQIRVTFSKNFEKTIKPIMKIADIYGSGVFAEPICFFGRAKGLYPDKYYFNNKKIKTIKKIDKYDFKTILSDFLLNINFMLSCPYGPVIFPNGDVFLSYCARPGLFIGNIKKQKIEEMLLDYNKLFFKRNFYLVKYFLTKNIKKAKIRCDVCPFVDPYVSDVDFIQQIINRHKVKGKELLDVACGAALHSFLLRKKGFFITGIDIDPHVLKIARKKIPSAKFICMDMKDLILKKEFDIIICMRNSIHYNLDYEELQKTLYNFYKHLKKRGVVIFDDGFINLDRWKIKDRIIDSIANLRLITFKKNKKNLIKASCVMLVKEKKGIKIKKQKLTIFNVNIIKNLMEKIGFSVFIYKIDNRPIFVGVK